VTINDKQTVTRDKPSHSYVCPSASKVTTVWHHRNLNNLHKFYFKENDVTYNDKFRDELEDAVSNAAVLNNNKSPPAALCKQIS